MQRIHIHRAILIATASLMAAFGFLSCSPLEDIGIPQTGYWYDLEIPAVVHFTRQGGSFTLEPIGVTYLDGQLISKKPLSEDEVEITFIEGSEDFLSRDGFTFITWQTGINHRAYYKVVWQEKDALAHLSILQYKFYEQ